ncbi:MAG: 3-phosphoshikimate 1-carboxyvinyltransferase [Phycisphaerae bacterium]|nr:3-phosphoshikimate 1-carboxyvinyltransferase [Phycisphaerae bacterium]
MTPIEFIEILNRPLADLPHELEMVPLPGPFNVEVRPPGSKSLTNRALLLAALAEGDSVITDALIDADDAHVMIEALRTLGAAIEITGTTLRIRGAAGRLRGGGTLNLKNAGTATRFLTAAACLADAPVIIDGNERMRQRPIGELVAMLRRLGVTIDELGAPGCVPLRVHPFRGPAHDLEVGATQSSQFISALCMIGPCLKGRWTLTFNGRPTSPSYITMTLAMMDDWLKGGMDGSDEEGAVHFSPSSYRGREWAIEPDASGATYFWGAGAINPGSKGRVPAITEKSLQGDARFAALLRSIAEAKTSAHDLTSMPDAAMTLAVVACFTDGATTITGLRTLRVKETDRLAALQAELSKLNVRVEILQIPDRSGKAPPDEGLRITPPPRGIDCSPSAPRVAFDTYDDHRMAMSLALVGLRRPNIVIRDPRCVAKTYPTFWNHLSLLYRSAGSNGALTRST